MREKNEGIFIFFIELIMKNKLLIVLVENQDYSAKELIHSWIGVFHVMELNYIFRDFHLKRTKKIFKSIRFERINTHVLCNRIID